LGNFVETFNTIITMQNISTTLQTAFIGTSFLTIFLFYKASQWSKTSLAIISLWAGLQLIIGLTDFYLDGYSMPPRFMLMIVPPMVSMLVLFNTKGGKIFIDTLNIKDLTLLHTVRVPVEITLYFLFVAKAIPEVMTFEGRNFDILAGLTAPIIYYFGFVKNQFSSRVILLWNLASLVTLFNIVAIAVLSAKTPLQHFGFEQPNVAIAQFPFNWLPSVVVPLVLFSHLVTIRKLLKKPA
jgi:hypothetical protein